MQIGAAGSDYGILHLRVIRYLLDNIARYIVLFCSVHGDAASPVVQRLCKMDEHCRQIAAVHGHRIVLSCDRIGDHGYHMSPQNGLCGNAVILHSNPEEGPADAGDHGGGADIQRLIRLQRRGDVEEGAAFLAEHLQLLSALADLHRAVLVQLDGLGIVQTDPGIALEVRGHGIAGEQAHRVPVFQLDLTAAAVGDGNGALGFDQLDDRCFIRRHSGG